MYQVHWFGTYHNRHRVSSGVYCSGNDWELQFNSLFHCSIVGFTLQDTCTFVFLLHKYMLYRFGIAYTHICVHVWHSIYTYMCTCLICTHKCYLILNKYLSYRNIRNKLSNCDKCTYHPHTSDTISRVKSLLSINRYLYEPTFKALDLMFH